MAGRDLARLHLVWANVLLHNNAKLGTNCFGVEDSQYGLDLCGHSLVSVL